MADENDQFLGVNEVMISMTRQRVRDGVADLEEGLMLLHLFNEAVAQRRIGPRDGLDDACRLLVEHVTAAFSTILDGYRSIGKTPALKNYVSPQPPAASPDAGWDSSDTERALGLKQHRSFRLLAGNVTKLERDRALALELLRLRLIGFTMADALAKVREGSFRVGSESADHRADKTTAENAWKQYKVCALHQAEMTLNRAWTDEERERLRLIFKDVLSKSDQDLDSVADIIEQRGPWKPIGNPSPYGEAWLQRGAAWYEDYIDTTPCQPEEPT